MKPIKIIKSAMTVGFWTLMSRVLGLMREILILALIGPGPALDAFVAAFRLPNMFRRFFAEGALSAAFVPMYTKRLESNDNADEFASEAFSALGFILLIFTGLAMVFMPALVWATAEGFAGTERFDMTVGYGRIMFPYIFLISLCALISGVLNARGYFAAAAAAPVFLNILIVAAMLIGAGLGRDPLPILVWAVPVAGVVQLGLVLWQARRCGFALRPRRPRWSPQMRHLVLTALPVAFAAGILQINLLVGQQVASQYEGAIGWLYAADRLYQLPLGVIAIAMGVVLLPDLSRRLSAEDFSGARWAYSRGAEFALLLTLPAAVALALTPLPLVSVLFERGQTDSEDIRLIAQATAIYGLGLPAFMQQKIIFPIYFSNGDTRTPTKYALIGLVVNAVVAIWGTIWFGWLAPAIAVSLSAWVMLGFLVFGAQRFGEIGTVDRRYWERAWRITLASLIMGAALFGFHTIFANEFQTAGLRYLMLLFFMLLAMAVYGTSCILFGATRLEEFKKFLKR